MSFQDVGHWVHDFEKISWPSYKGFALRCVDPLITTIFALLAVVYFGAMIFNTMNFGGKYSPDSFVYESVAQNISVGNGIAISMLPLGEAVVGNKTLPTPVTHYAPGYPLLVALFGGEELFVPVLMLGAFLFLTYWVMSLYFNRASALLGVALLTQFVPLREAASTAWSETTGLVFLALLFLALGYPRRGRLVSVLPLMAGLLAGLGYASRYALIPLIPIGLLFLIEMESKFRLNFKKTLMNWILFAGGASLVVVPIIARNWYYGFGASGAIDHSISQSLSKIMSDLLVIGSEVTRPATSYSMVVYGSLLSLLVIGVIIVSRTGLEGLNLKKEWQGKQLLFLAWPLAYLVFLTYCEATMPIDPVDQRLTLPAFAVIVMALSALVTKLSSLPKLVMATALVIMGASAYEEMHQAKMASEMIAKRGGVEERKPPDGLVWLSLNAKPSDLVVAEDGLAIPFYAPQTRVLYFSGKLSDQDVISSGKFLDYVGNHEDYDRVLFVLKGDVSEPMAGLTLEAQFEDRKIFSLENNFRVEKIAKK